MTYINCESWPEVEKTKNKNCISFTNRILNDNSEDECDAFDDIVYGNDVELLPENGHEFDYDYDTDFEILDVEGNHPYLECNEESFKDKNENIDVNERLDYYINLINEINKCERCTNLNCDKHHISDTTL